MQSRQTDRHIPYACKAAKQRSADHWNVGFDRQHMVEASLLRSEHFT
jgi:hypothetical protein